MIAENQSVPESVSESVPESVSEPVVVSESVPEYVSDAISEINKLISGFSFESDSDRANYLMALITPAVMSMIAYRVPMLAIDSIELANIIQVVHGMKPNVVDLKDIGDVIRSGTPICLVNKIDEYELARALACEYYSVRGSQCGLFKIKQMFIFVVDPPRIPYDIRRRSISCRSSKISEADAVGYAEENSTKIIDSIQKIVNHWHLSGCPIYEGREFVGYAEWIRFVGSIIHHCGLMDLSSVTASYHCGLYHPSLRVAGSITAVLPNCEGELK